MTRQIQNPQPPAPKEPQTQAAPADEPAHLTANRIAQENQDDGSLGTTAPSFGVKQKVKAPPQKVMQYRVERGPLPSGGWAVMISGSGKTELAAGKVIDERQYDIRKLKLQGVQLTEIGESQ